MTDTFRHKGLRKMLVNSIAARGITDSNVLEAMMRLPRHAFMDSSFLEFAYEDKPFPIGAGQTISQPFTVAFQTQLLEIRKGDKVLEIGTGSAYQSCVLIEMGARLYTIERQKTLFDKAKLNFQKLNFKPRALIFGDGYKGLPTYAPFDKILVTAGAPFVPQALINQLKPGGFLVIPVGDTIQTMKRIIKISQDEWKEENHGEFRFVPLLNEKAND